MDGLDNLNCALAEHPDPSFILIRQAAERYDPATGKNIDIEPCRNTMEALISDLGMREVNEIAGKRVRHTIRIRSGFPLYAAVPQDNTGEDHLIWNDATWRIIEVRKLKSTWKSLAVRTQDKKAKPNDPDPSTDGTSAHFIGSGRH